MNYDVGRIAVMGPDVIALSSRRQARPLCLQSSAILQEYGKPLAVRARGPARSPTRRSSPSRSQGSPSIPATAMRSRGGVAAR